jgi:hypothetical protein
MIFLVDTLKDHVGRMCERWSQQMRNPSEAVFYHSCRVLVNHEDQHRKYRVTILVKSSNCVDAEMIAKSHLRGLLADDRPEFQGEVSVRWLKGRLLSHRPKEDESATALDLLSRLRREGAAVVSSIDAVDVQLSTAPR